MFGSLLRNSSLYWPRPAGSPKSPASLLGSFQSQMVQRKTSDFELITTYWFVTYFLCHEASVRVPLILAHELSSLHFYDSNKKSRTKRYNNLQITRRSHGLWKMSLHLSPDGQLHGTRQQEESSETIGARSGGHCTHSGWHRFLVNKNQNLILFSSVAIFQGIPPSHCNRNWLFASQSVIYVLHDFMYTHEMSLIIPN